MKKAVIIGMMLVVTLGAVGLLVKNNRDVKGESGSKVEMPEEPIETPVEEIVETPVEDTEEVVETPVEEPEEPEEVIETPVEGVEEEPVEGEEEEVVEKTEKKENVIEFKEVKKNDSTLEQGKTKVVQNGVNGVETVVYLVTYTNGKETARVEKSRTITKAPVDKIVNVGTKAVVVAPKPVEPAPVEPKPTPVVVVKTETKEESIAFKEIRQDDATLESGKTVVAQEGVNGVKTITYSVTYTDGKETKRVVSGSAVTKNPVDRIVKVGTKVVPVEPFPAYGTVSFSKPNSVNGVWGWTNGIIEHTWYDGGIEGVWLSGWFGTPSPRAEWFKYASQALPVPTRQGAYKDEVVSAEIWVWVKK